MNRAAHWEQVYRSRGPEQLSWFQAEARLSAQLIQRTVPDHSASIVDIGAGASTLVDGLLASGYRALTVVDLSATALTLAQERLGALAQSVTWLTADVLTVSFAPACFDIWHDRAAFHFLTEAADRMRYVAQVRHAVRPGGHVLLATFAEDGPTRCSGLAVARYSPEALHAEFGAGFLLLESHREEHVTPSGARQAFTYCVCRADPGARVRRTA